VVETQRNAEGLELPSRINSSARGVRFALNVDQWDQRADADPWQIGCYTRCNYRRSEIGR
jgi:hypothetical protein